MKFAELNALKRRTKWFRFKATELFQCLIACAADDRPAMIQSTCNLPPDFEVIEMNSLMGADGSILVNVYSPLFPVNQRSDISCCEPEDISFISFTSNIELPASRPDQQLPSTPTEQVDEPSVVASNDGKVADPPAPSASNEAWERWAESQVAVLGDENRLPSLSASALFGKAQSQVTNERAEEIVQNSFRRREPMPTTRVAVFELLPEASQSLFDVREQLEAKFSGTDVKPIVLPPGVRMPCSGEFYLNSEAYANLEKPAHEIGGTVVCIDDSQSGDADLLKLTKGHLYNIVSISPDGNQVRVKSAEQFVPVYYISANRFSLQPESDWVSCKQFYAVSSRRI